MTGESEKEALIALMKMINEKYAGKIGADLEKDTGDLEEIKEKSDEASSVAEKMMASEEEEKKDMDLEKFKEFLAGGKKPDKSKSMKVFGQTSSMMPSMSAGKSGKYK